MRVDDVSLKIIPDSRGKDTLEATLKSGDISVSSSVPSGKSTGINEVFVLDPDTALLKFEDDLKEGILLHDFESLEQFDNYLINCDSTDNKKDLGGNMMLALSIGFTKLLAKSQNKEIYQLIAEIGNNKIEKLPLCFFNVINGGLHAKDSLPFQEYMFVPQNVLPSENLNSVMLLLKVLGDTIQKKYEHLRMGDEGGYEVPEKDPEIGLKILTEAIKESNQEKSKISLDVAASSFFKDGLYLVGDNVQTKDQLLDLYQILNTKYQILSIEDPFDEKDEDGFQKIVEKIGNQVWIVGDDLTTTNTERIKIMEDKKACNAVIIKPNQIGTVSEALEAVRLAQTFGWKVIVSHRSGETMDTFIADLAVGVGADGLKSGCPLQKERLVKYQRLIEIEKQLA
ncbi:MAG: enolase C-terminal domain-like protein [Microgenomates group bacterium]|jgi:enolase